MDRRAIGWWGVNGLLDRDTFEAIRDRHTVIKSGGDPNGCTGNYLAAHSDRGKLLAHADQLSAFVQFIACLLLDGEDDDGHAYEQKDDDAQDTLANLIGKARQITGIKGPGKPVCANFQDDGRGCCRNCGHFHGPDARTPLDDEEDHLQDLADRDRES